MRGRPYLPLNCSIVNLFTMKTYLLVFSFMFLANMASGQLQNMGFESWETNPTNGDPTKPSHWFGDQNPICYQETEAFDGNFALQVDVWYWYGKTEAFQVAPISSRPAALSGMYKYTNNWIRNISTEEIVRDTALVSIYLTRWNADLAQRDTLGKGLLNLFESTAYSSFLCGIEYSSAEMPDTIQVNFDPSILRRSLDISYFATTEDGRCSHFTIDQLMLLDTVTGIESNTTVEMFSLFPNPASDRVFIQSELGGAKHVEVIDYTGRIVHQFQIGNGENSIDVQHLPAGMYLLRTTDLEKRSQVKRFIKS